MFSFINKLFKPKAHVARLLQEGAVLIDVRTKSEYNAGHLPGSRNIPLDNIRSEVASLKKLNRPVVTVCRSGARSGVARSILKAQGVDAYNGGSWTSVKNLMKNS